MFGPVRGPWIDDGVHAALERAKEDPDIRLGGGAATIRQYLTAGLIDELHLVISSVLLGRGEHLLAGIDIVSLGYRCTEHASSEHGMHVVLRSGVVDPNLRPHSGPRKP
jgi:dihydrofolate reductase